MAATRSGRGLGGVFRGVLLAVLLVTAVIVGLLAMHTLNLHGTAAADSPASMTMSAAAAPGTVHHDATSAKGSGSPAGDRGTSCAGCTTDDHAGMATMCVLALLLILLLVIPPQVLRAWASATLRPHLTEVLTTRIPRAPSLHVLCISRT